MSECRSEVELADTFLKRTVGLMFRKPGTYHMEFMVSRPQRMVVHTFFMRFPIDVTFYNEAGIVLKTVKHLRPWRVAYCPHNVSRIVERTSET